MSYTGSPVGSITYEWKYSTSETGTYSSFSPAVKSRTFTPQTSEIGKWVKAFAVATSNAGDSSSPVPSATPALVMGAPFVPTFQTISRTNNSFMLYATRDGYSTLNATITSGPGTISYHDVYNGYYRIDVSGLSRRQSATVTLTVTRAGYNTKVVSYSWSSS